MANLKVAGVTVLYHPDESLSDNIGTYLYDIDLLFLVDNSEPPLNELPAELKDNPKIVYIKNLVNLGIAEALNIAAMKAIEKSFDFLLTMDQDSSFRPLEFRRFLNQLQNIDLTTVSIISPRHVHPTAKIMRHLAEREEVIFVMTSGNLLNLKIYKQVGPFDNALFIDHVDHEYCFRLISHGFKVLVVNHIILKHSLGKVTKIRLFGCTVMQFVSHAPIRTYYMIRNGLFVSKKYRALFPTFYRTNLSLIFKELIKIIFEGDKSKRLGLALLALKHYRISKMGKLNID